MLTRLCAVAVAVSLGVPSAAHAQGAAARVTVHGVAFDSLRGTPLAGAAVTMLGGARITSTDARGRFQFDSVAPGTYAFAAQHATIDSIGLSGISGRATVTDGRDEVRIAVPSFATLWRAVCGDAPAPRDSGFVYGTVRDGASQQPLPNAVVDATWIDVFVDRARTVTRTPWRGVSRSDASGSYVICGVPMDIGLRIRARANSASSGTVDLMPFGLRVQRRDLVVGHAVDSTHPGGTIAGIVSDSTGRPVGDARVIVDELPEIRSDGAGRFTVRGVPLGTRQVEVLALGMTPAMAVVDVVSDEPAYIAVRLRKMTTLDVVRVTASARVQLIVRDFEERRKLGFGYVRDSSTIASRGTMSGVFAEFPGVQVERGRNGASSFTVSMKATGPGRCTATLWIDGKQERDFELLNALRPNEIAAIEVYPRESTIPSRFTGRRMGCGAVIVWTKWSFG